MDLRQLAALTAIADHGSFSAAARELHTVQSNISSHIARLERELDATLVDRATGSLTDEGQAVVERARHIHTELDALRDDVASMHAEVSGTVRLGVIGTTARWLVPLLLQATRRAHPQIQLVVVDATTTSLLPRLAAGQLDVAVVNLPVDEPDLTADRLFDEDTIVVAPLGHPLYARTRVKLADLQDHELLLSAPGTAFRDKFDAEATDAGITITPQAEIDGMRLLASLAFQGFGAALLPASAASSWVEGHWKRVAVQGLEGRSVGLARRRRGQLSLPSRALCEVLLEVVRTEGSGQPGVYPATD